MAGPRKSCFPLGAFMARSLGSCLEGLRGHSGWGKDQVREKCVPTASEINPVQMSTCQRNGRLGRGTLDEVRVEDFQDASHHRCTDVCFPAHGLARTTRGTTGSVRTRTTEHSARAGKALSHGRELGQEWHASIPSCLMQSNGDTRLGSPELRIPGTSRRPAGRPRISLLCLA